MLFFKVSGLMTALIWDLYRLFILKEFMLRNRYVETIVKCMYYIFCSAIIFFSMRENQSVLYYLGFMRGNISKTLFFLFCGALVFPMYEKPDPFPEGEEDNSWVNKFGGLFLTACAIT